MTKQQIEQEVRLAISQAKPWSAIEPYEKQEKELVHQFLTSQITLEQFNQKIQELENDTGTLHFYSIADFTFALKCFQATVEQISGILEEQLPRFKHGINSSIPTRLSITPYRTEEGQLVLIPGIQNRIDELMNEEMVRTALKRIKSV